MEMTAIHRVGGWGWMGRSRCMGGWEHSGQATMHLPERVKSVGARNELHLFLPANCIPAPEGLP